MERDIRRKDRALSEEEARAVLDRCEYGTLSVTEGNGRPYAVPISYCVLDNNVYIHCALTGRKVEAFTPGAPVCFSCVGATQPVFDGGFSTYYESALVFGPIRKVEDDAEKRASLLALCQKYLPGDMDKVEEALQHSWTRTAVYAIAIERITGKAKRKKTA